MSIAVFLGPTLGAAQAGALVDARFLPPARFGDVYRAAVALRPRVIALVDGYFNQVPSVWHKEILWALNRGISVYGAASMGALRAAELEEFGMRGSGTVFNAYRDGRFPSYEDDFDSDDEVAIVHGPAGLGYPQLSEALVDIRATLTAAARAGVISRSTRDRLIAMTRRRFYADRTYPALIDDARTIDDATPQIESLQAWIDEGRVSVKRDDAIRLLQKLASQDPGPPPERAFRFEHTTLWDNALHDLSRPPALSSPVLDELRLLGPEYFALRDRVLDEAVETDDGFDGIASGDTTQTSWFDESLHFASLSAFRDAAPDRWLARRMLSHLRDSAKIEALQRRADDKAQRLKGRPTDSAALDEIDSLQLMDWYFGERLGCDMPADIEAYAANLGGIDVEAFRDLVLREYFYLHPDG